LAKKEVQWGGGGLAERIRKELDLCVPDKLIQLLFSLTHQTLEFPSLGPQATLFHTFMCHFPICPALPDDYYANTLTINFFFNCDSFGF
jgi:hypothetical protein